MDIIKLVGSEGNKRMNNPEAERERLKRLERQFFEVFKLPSGVDQKSVPDYTKMGCFDAEEVFKERRTKNVATENVKGLIPDK